MDILRMGDFDLNECPVELNVAVGIEEGYGTTSFALYCTQKLPDKDTHQYEGDCGESHNANANAVDNLIHERHQSIDAPGEVHIEEQYDGEEALSQPQEPFLGMRFDTLLCARNHYNAYALKLGFSIRSNTSRSSESLNLKVAVHISLKSEGDSDEESELDEHAFAKGKKVVKKRRRETIKQTNCKARMMVKLIDFRWEVTYFIGEHNHPLTAKPSLTKYLRRMMCLMSSFYGSGLLVPYRTKAISNYRSKLRSQMKGCDMAETISYFSDKKLDDPNFYFSVLLDDEQRSTQRSEGFNAVLKRYVNPHNSILNFVHQYEKIQLKILVKEGGNDYRTDHLKVQTWSSYPIEKAKFEMIGRYNVKHLGGDVYKLVRNKKYSCNYGTRTYKVVARIEEASYSCECCKFLKYGLLCCHILKIFTRCSVDEILEHYILQRWTQQAIQGENAGASEGDQPDVMPEQSEKQIRLANLSVQFGKFAKFASASAASKEIAKKHM
ncbi:hypothetical protein BRADI_1g31406v3, partial [Brachypodium distachyon]